MIRSLSQSKLVQSWGRNIVVFIFLAAILWVARYWHFMEFGLYEDDLTVIPKVMGMSGSQYLNLLVSHISILHPHGRPLSNSFIYTFTFLGSGESFSDLYLFGFLIVSLNMLLFYGLLRRFFDDSFAIIGGVAYALFSADTTQAFLTHSYAIHPSLMFLLLALHSYLSGKRFLTYVLGVLILFTYEAPFFMLIAAPLLSLRWDKKLLRELLVHTFILIVIIGGIYAFRTSVGDFRSVDPTIQNLVITPLLHMVEGPVVALGTYFYRPVQAILAMNVEVFTAIVVTFILFSLVLYRFLPARWEEVRGLIDSIRKSGLPSLKDMVKKKSFPFVVPSEVEKILKLVVLGSFLLVLAYPLTFTVRAYAISGRDTRVHFAAVVGAAMLWACVGWLVLAIGESLGRRRIVVTLLAGLFALLVGYGFVIQKDYIDAWDYQQEFWSELTQLISDADEGTVILVEPTSLKYTRQIGSNTWNLPRILDQIFIYPSEWEHPPRVYRLIPEWQDTIVRGEGQFAVNEATTIAPAPLYRVVPLQRM